MLLGQMLIKHAVIDAPALGKALLHQRDFGGRIGEVLVSLGLAREEHVVAVLARQLGVPVTTLGERTIAPGLLRLVPERVLRTRRALPLWIAPRRWGRGGELVVAFADPTDLPAIDDIGFAAGMPVRPVLAGARDLTRALDRHFGVAIGSASRQCVDAIGVAEDDGHPMVVVDVREYRYAQ